MTKVLSYLLQEEDAKEDDYAVAVSLANEKNDYIRAYSWARAGVLKYPQSKVLAPLYLESLRLADKKNEALIYLSGMPADFAKLPMIQLEK